MITKQQFKRLTLVIAIPLLLFGWWLAEYEVIFKTNYIIDCEEFDTHFSCVGFQTNHKVKNEYFTNSGGIRVRNSARLTNGFNHPVVTLGINETEYKNGALQVTGTIGAGISKNLIIDRNIGANYSGNGPCWLSPYADNDTNWAISCVRESPGGFTFQNSATAKKFREMFEEVKREEEKLDGFKVRAYSIQILIPLLAYILLSVLLLITSKIIRYVINGKQAT